MSMFREFRDFAVKGNVIDMAVGLIIGAAFGKIVSSLVQDVVMPPIGLLLGGVDFSNLKFTLKEAVAATDTTVAVEAVSLNYGTFINAVLDFLIVAFAIFIVIKQMNRLKRQPPPSDPTTKACPQCEMTIPIKAVRCGFCTSALESA